MRSGGFARSGKLTPRGTSSIADDARATFAAERGRQQHPCLATSAMAVAPSTDLKAGVRSGLGSRPIYKEQNSQ